MNKLTPIAASLTLLFSAHTFAQPTKIIGVVANAKSSLANVKVKVIDTNVETVTDSQGSFQLNQLPPGSYQVEISSAGYQKRLIAIKVTADENENKVNVLLEPLNKEQVETIEVYGQIVRGEQVALSAQQASNRIVNIISTDAIGKLPDRNAAEAVQRIPGVSIERDQGEGRFVAVRGLPAQWSSASVNGNRLPTAEEETTSRATAFDFFPSELIEIVEVSKALTPDMEGDAIGGNVNFVTKTSPNARTLKISGGLGTQEKAGKTNYNANVLYGDRSTDNNFGFLINATAQVRDWATDNFEARRGNDGIGIRRLELRDYTGKRETYGLNLAADYQFDDGEIYFRGLYGTLIDDETHFKHRYRFDKDRIELQNIHNELITELTGYDFGGEHFLSYYTSLKWQLSSYENEFKYGNLPDAEDNSYFVVRFDQKNVGFTGIEDRGTGKRYAYNTIDGGSDPMNMISTHLPSNFKMDPTQTRLSWVELYKVYVSEKDKIVAQLDLEHEANDELSLKFGAKYRDKERIATFSDEFYKWDSSKGDTPTLANFNLIDQPGRGDYLEELSINYHKDFSQVVPVNDLNGWWKNNKQNLLLDKDESALVSNGGALGRHFTVNEKHLSGYAMGTYEPSEYWSIVGGVRVTKTSTDVEGFTYLEDQDHVVASKGEKDYTSVLPSLHVTYKPTENTNYRLALTRSFARPDFGALAPGGTYAEAENEYVSGNPELNPTYSFNIDLMVEHFFDTVGLASAGIFYKDIKDPIFSNASKGTFNGIEGVDVFRPENGEDAWLAGAEVAFSRTFEFISPILRHFGVMANATWLDSKMTTPDREDVAIPRQANSLYNIALYYDTKDLSARIALNHKGDYIEEHGSEAKFDRYYGEYTSLDMTASYNFNENASVYLELRNLTNEPLTYFLGQKERQLQVEYYGTSGTLGFHYNF